MRTCLNSLSKCIRDEWDHCAYQASCRFSFSLILFCRLFFISTLNLFTYLLCSVRPTWTNAERNKMTTKVKDVVWCLCAFIWWSQFCLVTFYSVCSSYRPPLSPSFTSNYVSAMQINLKLFWPHFFEICLTNKQAKVSTSTCRTFSE